MLYFECKPDELLCQKLGIPKRLREHKNDKGRICKYLWEKCNGDFGLIDQDPGSAQPKHLTEHFDIILPSKYGLQLLKDRKGNSIVIIEPKLEGWIIKVCNNHRIEPTKYGLPSEMNKLHGVINLRLNSFGNLLDEMISKKLPEVAYLKELLSSQ